MAGAVEKLVGDHELQRLVLFLQRSDGGDGNDPLHAELLEAVNVGAEIQLGGQNAVSASVAGQKRNLAAFQRAQDIGVGGLPNGVFRRTSLTLVRPGMEYSPLPPMIPISACGKGLLGS